MYEIPLGIIWPDFFPCKCHRVVKGLDEEQSGNADGGRNTISHKPGGRDYRETCDPQNTDIHHSVDKLVGA